MIIRHFLLCGIENSFTGSHRSFVLRYAPHNSENSPQFDPITQPATGHSGTIQQRIKPKTAAGGVSRLNSSQMGRLIEIIQQLVKSITLAFEKNSK